MERRGQGREMETEMRKRRRRRRGGDKVESKRKRRGGGRRGNCPIGDINLKIRTWYHSHSRTHTQTHARSHAAPTPPPAASPSPERSNLLRASGLVSVWCRYQELSQEVGTHLVSCPRECGTKKTPPS